MTVIEVFADVSCPFTHIGLRYFVARRTELRRDDVLLHVRAWPLELVNGEAMDPEFVAEEVQEIRSEMSTDLFGGFTAASFPATSMPALALAAAAYELDMEVGEAVSLELRDLLFEKGVDISDRGTLEQVADRHGVSFDPNETASVVEDHRIGTDRGVIGSPHFFTPTGSYFCPALDVSRDGDGKLRVNPAPTKFAAFLESCFT